MVKELADHLAFNLGHYLEKEENVEAYSFALQLIIVQIISFAGIFLLAGFFRIVPEALAFVAALTLIRGTGGGVHHKTLPRCFLTTSVMVLLPSYYSIWFYRDYVIALTVLLLLVALVRWVPASKKQDQASPAVVRKVQRLLGIGLLIWSGSLVVLVQQGQASLAGALVAGALGSVLFVSPLGYTMIRIFDLGWDRLINNLKGGKER